MHASHHHQVKKNYLTFDCQLVSECISYKSYNIYLFRKFYLEHRNKSLRFTLLNYQFFLKYISKKFVNSYVILAFQYEDLEFQWKVYRFDVNNKTKQRKNKMETLYIY